MGLFSHVLPYVSNRYFFHCTQLTFRSSTLLRQASYLIHSPDVYYPSSGAADRKSITYFPRRETSMSDYPALPWGRTWKIYRRKLTTSRRTHY